MLTRAEVQQAIKKWQANLLDGPDESVWLDPSEFTALVHYLHKAESDLAECEAALNEIDRKANDYDEI